MDSRPANHSFGSAVLDFRNGSFLTVSLDVRACFWSAAHSIAATRAAAGSLDDLVGEVLECKGTSSPIASAVFKKQTFVLHTV
jgi:hypothetical protein